MAVKSNEQSTVFMRAAGYGRVSTEEQANEGHSLDAQRDYNLNYIKNEKWVLAGYFEDPGYSGKNLKRPDITRLLNEVRAGNIDAIVVHKLDRLTRDIKDLYELLQLFDSKNIKLVSISEKIDTSSAMGRMFVFMLGIFAQWYRENLSEEVAKGMRKRAQKGLHNVTVDLFGYTLDENNNLLIKEEEAKWVRWIFDKYISGKGSISISRELNNIGIRRNQGSLWDQGKVIKVLKNYHYIGKIHLKIKRDPDRIIEDGIHEAIISEETFDRAQRILERRKEGFLSANSYDYIYSGILRCSKCGGSFVAKMNKQHNKLYRGYICSNHMRYGICDQKFISEMKMNDLLFKNIDLIGKDYDLTEIPSKPRSEDEDIKKAIRESELRRERWQMAYGDGNMPYEDFSRRMKEEMARLVELEERLSTIPQHVVSYLTPEDAKETVNTIKENWNDLDQATRKEIIQSLFQEITIRKEGKQWYMDNIVLA